MPISVTNGKNFQIKNKINGVDTNLYPITRFANVLNSSNEDLTTVLAALRQVPAAPAQDADKKFLAGDGTWKTIVINDGTTSVKGIVQLSDTVEEDSSKAATPTAVKSVADDLATFVDTTAPATYVAIDDISYGEYDGDATYNVANIGSDGYVPAALINKTDSTSTESSTILASATAVKTVADSLSTFTGTTAPATYVAKADINSANGVAGLDSNGIIPQSILPSYVDDVIEGYVSTTTTTNDTFKLNTTDATGITGETGKIYVDKSSNKSYRFSGSIYVEISKSLVIGTTEGTAYDGALGAAVRNDLDDHLSDTTSNPHNITATTVGLGNVENKDGETIVSENVTTAYIKTTLGSASSSSDGYMTSAQAGKLDSCMQTEVIYQDEEATIEDGIVFEILEDAPTNA